MNNPLRMKIECKNCGFTFSSRDVEYEDDPMWISVGETIDGYKCKCPKCGKKVLF